MRAVSLRPTVADLDALRAKFPGFKIISQPSPACNCKDGVRRTRTGREVLCICVCLSAPEPGEEDYRPAVGMVLSDVAREELAKLRRETGRG